MTVSRTTRLKQATELQNYALFRQLCAVIAIDEPPAAA
jgi:hypothetical protein